MLCPAVVVLSAGLAPGRAERQSQAHCSCSLRLRPLTARLRSRFPAASWPQWLLPVRPFRGRPGLSTKDLLTNYFSVAASFDSPRAPFALRRKAGVFRRRRGRASPVPRFPARPRRQSTPLLSVAGKIGQEDRVFHCCDQECEPWKRLGVEIMPVCVDAIDIQDGSQLRAEAQAALDFIKSKNIARVVPFNGASFDLPRLSTAYPERTSFTDREMREHVAVMKVYVNSRHHRPSALAEQHVREREPLRRSCFHPRLRRPSCREYLCAWNGSYKSRGSS